MAIAITPNLINGSAVSVVLDETENLQNFTATSSPAGDADDNDAPLSLLPSVLSTRLSALGVTTAEVDEVALSGYSGAAGNTGANIINVTGATASTDFALTSTGGATFPDYTTGQTSTFNSGLSAVEADGSTTPIFLFADPDNNNIVYGVAGDSGDDPIVFAVYLEEIKASGITTGAKMWSVLVNGYTLAHNTDGTTVADHDDSLDLTNKLFVAAVAEADFSFANAPSGQNLFMMFGTTSLAILVTGEDPANQSAGQNVSNDGDTVNTGQGGGATTLGTEGQQIKAQKAMVVTFVTGANSDYLVPGLSPTEANLESNIAFTGYATDVRSAEFTISQMTPGNTNTTATVEVAAYLTADGTGNSYIDNNALVQGDTAINITTGSVQVLRDGVDVVGTQGVEVNYDGFTAVITGVKDDDVIKYTTDADHNRVLIRNDQPAQGQGSNVAFDLGGFTVIQTSSDVEEVGSKVKFEDDGPVLSVDNATGTFSAGAQGTWNHASGTDGFQGATDSLSVTFDSYEIDTHGSKTPAAGSLTQTGDFAFDGSITDDFNGDGKNETVEFTLTFDPTNPESYDLQVTTPPATVTTFDTSQGSLKAGGPDAVQTLLFGGSEAGADDIVFFGAVATAPIENGSPPPYNDIEDLVVTGATDLTEGQIEALFPIPTLITPSTQMNVSTSGIGVNNNNLNGASEGNGTGAFAGTTITSGDESFVVNPETVVDKVTVYIDNSVGGYNPGTEDLYFTVYYTDGTTSGPSEVTAAMLDDVTSGVARGGKSFDIEGGAKQIDAVQLTMGVGTIKIPVIAFSIEQVFEPEPLSLDFTATLFDGDGDSATDTFSIDLDDATT